MAGLRMEIGRAARKEQEKGQRGQPAPATDDRDPLKEAAELAQALGAGKSVAGEHGRDQHHDTAEGTVACPAALALGGEPAGEHQAGRHQRREPEPCGEVVQDAMHAGIWELGRGSGWIPSGRVGDEDAGAEQTDRPQPDEQGPPQSALSGPEHTSHADGERQGQHGCQDEV